MRYAKQTPPNRACASLVEPFGFKDRLRQVDSSTSFIPVLDMIVIAMLVSLLFTRFVTLPGVRIDLPTTEMRMQHSEHAVAVLTIGNNGMLFFDGAVVNAASIERGFEAFIDSSDREIHVLLIKANFTMEIQDFLQLCELAKAAGFHQVQLAGKKNAPVQPLLSQESSGFNGN